MGEGKGWAFPSGFCPCEQEREALHRDSTSLTRIHRVAAHNCRGGLYVSHVINRHVAALRKWVLLGRKEYEEKMSWGY